MACSLYHCTNLAGICGVLETVAGLCWNIWLLIMFKKFDDEDRELTRGNFTFEEEELYYYFRDLPNRKDIYSAAIFSTTLHGLWLISSLALLIGNMKYSRILLTQWIPITLTIILTDILASIYFTLRLGGFLKDNSVMNNPAPLLLAVLFSRGCLLFVFLNAFLIHYVCRRCWQIAARKYSRKQVREYFEESPVSELRPQVHRHIVGGTIREHRISVQQPVFVKEEKPEDEKTGISAVVSDEVSAVVSVGEEKAEDVNEEQI